MNDVTIVTGDDWQGCYIDRKLVDQGHSLTIRDIFRILGIEAKFKWIDQTWIEDQGALPESLEDVKFSGESL